MDSADISQQAISHTYSLWSKNLENLIPVLDNLLIDKILNNLVNDSYSLINAKIPPGLINTVLATLLSTVVGEEETDNNAVFSSFISKYNDPMATEIIKCAVLIAVLDQIIAICTSSSISDIKNSVKLGIFKLCTDYVDEIIPRSLQDPCKDSLRKFIVTQFSVILGELSMKGDSWFLTQKLTAILQENEMSLVSYPLICQMMRHLVYVPRTDLEFQSFMDFMDFLTETGANHFSFISRFASIQLIAKIVDQFDFTHKETVRLYFRGEEIYEKFLAIFDQLKGLSCNADMKPSCLHTNLVIMQHFPHEFYKENYEIILKEEILAGKLNSHFFEYEIDWIRRFVRGFSDYDKYENVRSYCQGNSGEPAKITVHPYEDEQSRLERLSLVNDVLFASTKFRLPDLCCAKIVDIVIGMASINLKFAAENVFPHLLRDTEEEYDLYLSFLGASSIRKITDPSFQFLELAFCRSDLNFEQNIVQLLEKFGHWIVEAVYLCDKAIGIHEEGVSDKAMLFKEQLGMPFSREVSLAYLQFPRWQSGQFSKVDCKAKKNANFYDFNTFSSVKEDEIVRKTISEWYEEIDQVADNYPVKEDFLKSLTTISARKGSLSNEEKVMKFTANQRRYLIQILEQLFPTLVFFPFDQFHYGKFFIGLNLAHKEEIIAETTAVVIYSMFKDYPYRRIKLLNAVINLLRSPYFHSPANTITVLNIFKVLLSSWNRQETFEEELREMSIAVDKLLAKTASLMLLLLSSSVVEIRALCFEIMDILELWQENFNMVAKGVKSIGQVISANATKINQLGKQMFLQRFVSVKSAPLIKKLNFMDYRLVGKSTYNSLWQIYYGALISYLMPNVRMVVMENCGHFIKEYISVSPNFTGNPSCNILLILAPFASIKTKCIPSIVAKTFLDIFELKMAKKDKSVLNYLLILSEDVLLPIMKSKLSFVSDSKFSGDEKIEFNLHALNHILVNPSFYNSENPLIIKAADDLITQAVKLTGFVFISYICNIILNSLGLQRSEENQISFSQTCLAALLDSVKAQYKLIADSDQLKKDVCLVINGLIGNPSIKVSSSDLSFLAGLAKEWQCPIPNLLSFNSRSIEKQILSSCYTSNQMIKAYFEYFVVSSKTSNFYEGKFADSESMAKLKDKSLGMVLFFALFCSQKTDENIRRNATSLFSSIYLLLSGQKEVPTRLFMDLCMVDDVKSAEFIMHVFQPYYKEFYMDFMNEAMNCFDSISKSSKYGVSYGELMGAISETQILVAALRGFLKFYVSFDSFISQEFLVMLLLLRNTKNEHSVAELLTFYLCQEGLYFYSDRVAKRDSVLFEYEKESDLNEKPLLAGSMDSAISFLMEMSSFLPDLIVFISSVITIIVSKDSNLLPLLLRRLSFDADLELFVNMNYLLLSQKIACRYLLMLKTSTGSGLEEASRHNQFSAIQKSIVILTLKALVNRNIEFVSQYFPQIITYCIMNELHDNYISHGYSSEETYENERAFISRHVGITLFECILNSVIQLLNANDFQFPQDFDKVCQIIAKLKKIIQRRALVTWAIRENDQNQSIKRFHEDFVEITEDNSYYQQLIPINVPTFLSMICTLFSFVVPSFIAEFTSNVLSWVHPNTKNIECTCKAIEIFSHLYKCDIFVSRDFQEFTKILFLNFSSLCDREFCTGDQSDFNLLKEKDSENQMKLISSVLFFYENVSSRMIDLKVFPSIFWDTLVIFLVPRIEFSIVYEILFNCFKRKDVEIIFQDEHFMSYGERIQDNFPGILSRAIENIDGKEEDWRNLQFMIYAFKFLPIEFFGVQEDFLLHFLMSSLMIIFSNLKRASINRTKLNPNFLNSFQAFMDCISQLPICSKIYEILLKENSSRDAEFVPRPREDSLALMDERERARASREKEQQILSGRSVSTLGREEIIFTEICKAVLLLFPKCTEKLIDDVLSSLAVKDEYLAILAGCFMNAVFECDPTPQNCLILLKTSSIFSSIPFVLKVRPKMKQLYPRLFRFVLEKYGQSLEESARPMSRISLERGFNRSTFSFNKVSSLLQMFLAPKEPESIER